MKKILMLSVLAAVAFVGCKKKEDTVSRVVSVSYPTVTIVNSQFYSFPVGGGPLPNANTIIATAYDSFYHQSIKPVVDASEVSDIIPGLYIITVSAKNTDGFLGYNYVYVAITSEPDSINVAGQYVRQDNFDTVNVTKIGAGFYRTDNVGGNRVTPGAAVNTVVPGYFVMGSDNSSLYMQTQPSPIGTFSGTGSFNLSPGDTAFQYVIKGNTNFDGTNRVFKKL